MDRMNSMKTSSVENLKADIVVIGGGASGLPAAVATAEKGVKNVIVLEARRIPGGNAPLILATFATGSRLQKHLGIEARPDALFKQAMSYAHWKINPRLVSTLMEKSGDTMRWLEEKGVSVDGVITADPNQVPVAHFSKGKVTIGVQIARALAKSCEDLGVQFLFQTKAKKLLTNESGKVVGVLAKVKGKEIRIIAKSVIIATGGFAGSKKLLKKYLPSYNEGELHRMGIHHKGDGLRMATEVGAATEGMTVLEMTGQVFPWSRSISPRVMQPHTLWVNKRGERFTDETLAFVFPESSNAVYSQPGKISYTLFDEKIKQAMVKQGLSVVEELLGGISSGLEQSLELQAKKGRVKIADSWDDIASWMGVKPKVLKSTVDEYNYYCDRGHDDVFAKDRRYLLPLRTPPYYAIQCCINFMTTHGGIKINHRTEVLDNQDNPIPGLYAAGVETGGTDSNTYNINLPGHSSGFSINSGRIAGESAAEYVLASD
jgi:fumarate reductase flavoprotein subunit